MAGTTATTNTSAPSSSWRGVANSWAMQKMGQSMGAKTIGKGLATVAITVVILNQILTIDAINNSTGPFTGVIDSVANIGSSALTLVVLAFLVLGGAVAMGFMDRF